ncbi:ABC transporter substrate-binding protein [Frigidibacter albus]|uniref:ABC transporter substrate-binding protein n=1 Tax=Frigidibacter albus TaxID=1465486 RepID=A0A6L8VGQ4_9RHOB|nr:ABC transporter substrate-binding protein [Frigidibacter albus]MZQ88390.1 ABC transporter substrate-binding protein [Frigidibacter albus]NBE29936.1 ABC transporter substrate-binding protein [Frigidibacter albus]
MSACAAASDRPPSGAALARRAGAALAVVLALFGTAHAETPARVVSMNLCTDQLALLLADPGQIVSLSYMASDPSASAMAAEAAAYPSNRGRAEELYLLKPDLVLASTFSSPGTLSMLNRLGLRVETYPPGATMEELRQAITDMGAALGQPQRAAALLADFDAQLAALSAPPLRRPRAALYSEGSYASGARTLEGQVMQAAGFDNIATEHGLDWGGRMPLEVLVMSAPEVVITETGRPGTKRARAQAVLSHPAMAQMRRADVVAHQDWICATPRVLDAIAALTQLRRQMERE